MTASQCPSFAKLLDFSEGKLTASSRRRVDHHLKGGCAKCRESTEWVLQHLPLMNSLDLQGPSEDVVANTIALFRKKGPGRKGWIRISSSFEMAGDLQLHGVRSGDAGPYQKSLETSSYRISLMLAYDRTEMILAGQLEGKSANAGVAHCLVEIVSGKKNLGSTSTNERGEFLFPKLRMKNFELRIHGEPDSILIAFDADRSTKD